jgi:catechol 2,3-dioxygenase-like lactoylglutathione lyase family enzyme
MKTATSDGMHRPAELSHLFITVTNLAAARAFWTEAVGLATLVDEGAYVRVGGGEGFLMGIEEAAAEARPEVEVVVRVPDVDATYQQMTAAGIEFEAAPADMPWGARHAWLRDPDGRRVSLYSPISKEGPA